MKRIVFFTMFLSVLLLVSCSDDEITSGKYGEGYYISNEGTFLTGNGSVSYFNTRDNTIENNIFQNVNGRPLGDVVQSITFHNGLAYIIVNNSNKMEVVNANTFESVATVEGLSLPRQFAGITNDKGYVTQWGDGFSGSIQIIDLNTFTITGEFATGGNGPDKMTVVGDKIYVAHNGGFDRDNIVTVVDPFTDTVLEQLTLGDNPAEIVVDRDGDLWVLCQGYFDWTTYETFNGSLMELAADHSIKNDWALSGSGGADMSLNENGTSLTFLMGGQLNVQDVSATSLSLENVSSADWVAPYGAGYDGSNGRHLLLDAKDFTSQGELFILDAAGVGVSSHLTGVVPSEVFVR